MIESSRTRRLHSRSEKGVYVVKYNQYYEVGKLADPEFRRDRAKKAAAARLSVETAVKRIVTRADELTEEHRRQLATILATDGGPR
jgi:hypothetical protein